VAPLSGRWARQGQLKKMGAEMAIEEINSQGGIKALGGAKIVLREADAGDSVEKAVSAAQRVLTREKNQCGYWFLAFLIHPGRHRGRRAAAGAVALALLRRLPSPSAAFKYTFQTSPVSSLQAEQALDLVSELAKKNNKPIKKAAIVGDNTAATVFFFKPLREKLLAAKGIELVVDEVWTPPLADATASRRSSAPPSPTSSSTAPPYFNDSIQVLQKVKEFRREVADPGRGRVAGHAGVRHHGRQGDARQHPDRGGSHPVKGQDELVKKFVQRTKEPFMTQDPLVTYSHVWLIKEAIEQAKSADPKPSATRWPRSTSPRGRRWPPSSRRA